MTADQGHGSGDGAPVGAGGGPAAGVAVGAEGAEQDARMAALVARLQAGAVVPASELAMTTADGFATRGLGLVFDDLAWDHVTGHLEADARHHQPYGIVHGGVWCAVVETLASFGGALRAAASGLLVVGVNNTTDFLRAHRTGRIDAIGRPVHVGRTQQLWSVELTRASDGKAVARGQVRLQQLEPSQVAGR